jgi:hypothetical protein
MVKSLRMGAEAKFAKADTASTRTIKEKEKARPERVNKVARLRALCLAVKASEKDAKAKAEAKS